MPLIAQRPALCRAAGRYSEGGAGALIHREVPRAGADRRLIDEVEMAVLGFGAGRVVMGGGGEANKDWVPQGEGCLCEQNPIDPVAAPIGREQIARALHPLP